MKLFLACVAALSLFGCAEDPTSNGGQNLAGVRPAKPSIDDPTNTNQPANPHIFDGMNGTFSETINPHGAVDGLCDNCEVIAIHVPTAKGDSSLAEEVDMFGSDGAYLCRLQRNELGSVTANDCGNWYTE